MHVLMALQRESRNQVEIKPFGLASRIRDTDAKSYNWSHLLMNIWITFYFFWLAEIALWDEINIEFSAKVCAHFNIFGL